MKKHNFLHQELRGQSCEQGWISASQKAHQKEQVWLGVVQINLVAVYHCCTLGNMACKKAEGNIGLKHSWDLNLDNLGPAKF